MIDKATVKKILDTANIVEVVSDYVSLTKRGSNYMGLCPFHNERTPSFSVSPARGICKCFSCGKGGSPINFIMEKEGINYHDALLHLARKYGIKVEERELSDEEKAEQSRRESMLVVSEWAMRQFEHHLRQSSEGQDVGLTYLYKRGVTQAAIDRFHLGYNPDKPEVLYNAAVSKGFDASTLIETGLCGLSSRDSRPYDRFRGRIIFPIFSASGKVIAFGGRGIKGEPAKYVNSPESPIYHKSDELYGIYQAKNAIVRQKKCYLVEGYMDVIGMWQSGMENTVASSGTSLTDGQIALIHRFTDNVTLIYDGDAAGVKASLRGIDLLLSHKLDIKVLLLPDGDDPDSFSLKHTPEEFRAYVEEHEEDFISFKTRTLLSTAKSGSAAERAAAVRSIVTSIASVPDLVKRSFYIQETARTMDVPERILAIEVGKALEETNARLRQRRQFSRLEAERREEADRDSASAQPGTQPASSAPQRQAAQALTGVTPEQAPAPVDSRLLKANAQVNPMAEVEKNVIEYVIKYGMYTFCENTPNQKQEDATRWLNVAEYVDVALADDSMQFTIPLYAHILEKVLAMSQTYREEERRLEEEYAHEQKREMEEWCRQKASEGLSMKKLEAEERKFADAQEEKRIERMTEFATDYTGRLLGSDPDDEVRHLALEVIIPRYSLSKYHNKNVHVATELERLPELLPRALYEWKDALMAQAYKETQAALKQEAASGDSLKIESLVRKLQQISDFRRELAKTLGERIINPRI